MIAIIRSESFRPPHHLPRTTTGGNFQELILGLESSFPGRAIWWREPESILRKREGALETIMNIYHNHMKFMIESMGSSRKRLRHNWCQVPGENEPLKDNKKVNFTEHRKTTQKAKWMWWMCSMALNSIGLPFTIRTVKLHLKAKDRHGPQS